MNVEMNGPPSASIPQNDLLGETYGSRTTEAPVSLACYSCRKRKVRCDRLRPICSLCVKTKHHCKYPSGPEKPGPKPRSESEQGTKRRRVNEHQYANTSTQEVSSNRGSGSQQGSFDLPRGSVASIYSPGHDASHNSGPSAEVEAGTVNVPSFSRIMYPSHEAQTRPQTPLVVEAPVTHRSTITVQSVSEALQINKETYDMLMTSYFDTMTSFSLFRPGSIKEKFSMMKRHADAEALVAAMFSLSARHCAESSDCPKPSYFAHIAVTKLDESVNSYGDLGPPFWLMQAGILVTFYQLTQRVRSRSWNRLGNCVRYAYDFNLHIIDTNHSPKSMEPTQIDIRRWSLLEERRRAWWAVWEMDVFASTIRRLPTAIDGSQNFTLLPVPDECWFNDVYQPSCLLAQDCSLRWKLLAESGNQSSKAWFLVVNSLMRNTQRIVYPAGSAGHPLDDKETKRNEEELAIMANSLSCTIMSLPNNLTYQGETLHFGPNARQEHADKYAIHLMTQLCRFMIYHHKISAQAPWLSQKGPSEDQSTPVYGSSEWSNYMNASDEIVNVVRNSARDHYRYVNPFLANTLWFAAAAQCACGVFGPATFNKRLVNSNLELLKLTIDRFISFWEGMENLKGKLARIEAGLKSLMANGGTGSDQRDTQKRQRVEAGASGGQIVRTPAIHNNAAPAGPAGQSLDIETTSGNAGSMLLPPPTPIGMDGWSSDLRWTFPFAPDVSDFAQPFDIADGQNFPAVDALDFSPFGLEELLRAGMHSSV